MTGVATTLLALCGYAAAQPSTSTVGAPAAVAPPPVLAPSTASPAMESALAPPAVFKPKAPLLKAPPAEARAGECYAHVRIPGEPLYAPPGPPQALWVLTPGGPGQGPLWCLTYRPGARPLTGYSPGREGWIRVVCARKAARAPVRPAKRRLRVRTCRPGAITSRAHNGARVSAIAVSAHLRRHHGGFRLQSALSMLPTPPASAMPTTIAGFSPCAAPACPAPPILPAGALSPRSPSSRPLLTWPGKSLY